MRIVQILSIIAFIGSVFWFISKPNYDSALSIITSLGTFFVSLYTEKKSKKQSNLRQTVSSNGVGVQAGGDINMGSIRSGKETTNAE